MKIKRGIAVAAAVAGIGLLVPTAANAAASGHPISGTAYSDGSWFVSSNVRTMASTYIKASFTTAPSKGLAFGVQNYQTGARLGSVIYAPPTTTQTIYSGGKAGTEFVNYFKLQVKGHQDNYSFSGSETY